MPSIYIFQKQRLDQYFPSYIKRNGGFILNFILGMTFILIAMFYIIFFLEDSRDLRPPEVVEELKAKEEEVKGRKEKVNLDT